MDEVIAAVAIEERDLPAIQGELQLLASEKTNRGQSRLGPGTTTPVSCDVTVVSTGWPASRRPSEGAVVQSKLLVI